MEWADKITGMKYTGTVEEWKAWREANEKIVWTDDTGIRYTGTPAEKRAWEKATHPVEKKVIVIKDREIEVPRRKRHSWWNKEEDKTLREHASEGVSHLRKLLPHRTRTALRIRARKLKIELPKLYHAHKHHKDVEKGDKGWTPGEEEILLANISKPSKTIGALLKRSTSSIDQHKHQMRKQNRAGLPSRDAFIKGKTASYVRILKWSFEKARRQAVDDWTSKTGKIGTITPAITPEQVKTYKTYTLMCLDWDAQEAKTVDTYGDLEEAKAKMEELRVAAESIGEKKRYFIKKNYVA